MSVYREPGHLRYEYRVIGVTGCTFEEVEDTLCKLGAEGFQLKHYVVAGCRRYMILERSS